MKETVDLLCRIQLSIPDRYVGGNVVPLALPFPVDPSSAPYIVSGSKEPVVWVPSAPNGRLHAAIRPSSGFNTEVVDAVTAMGMQAEWGNIHNLSVDGVLSCIQYLESYGIADVDLVTSGDSLKNIVNDRSFPDGYEPTIADWMPEACAIAVPRDRKYLGWIAEVLPGKIVSVVHNPSRGMAIARS